MVSYLKKQAQAKASSSSPPASGTTPASRAAAKAAGQPTTYTARKINQAVGEREGDFVQGKGTLMPDGTYEGTSAKPSNISSRIVTTAGGQTLTGDAAMNDGKPAPGPIATQTTQINSAMGTGEREGDFIPGKGTLMPDGSYEDPNAEAPQALKDQVSQLEGQVGNYAQSKGLTLQKTPQGGYTTVPNLAQQAQQKLDILNQSGQQYTTQGQAGAALTQASAMVGGEQESPSIIGGLMETDPNFDSILTSYDDFFSPVKQKQSLLKEYKSLSAQLGIEAMNEELIDAKQIIEGTEDDIRAEITGAGGLATESLVVSLGNARNKSLIKNYNYLLESRDSAMTQLNTMMNLSVQDRQFAEAEFDRKLGFAFKVAEFKERATTNARSGIQKIVDTVGYKGLYQSLASSPYEVALAEKTLGLGAGGLLRLASAPPSLDDQYKQAQIDNIYSQIGERNTPTVGAVTLSGKPQTTAQASANGYADRLSEANMTIGSMGSNFTSTGSFGGLLPNFLQSPERQQYEQAKRNFVNAVLRRESGAAISPTEFSSAEKQYFPQAGDKDAVIQQKAQNRNTVINNVYREADVQRPVMPGQIIESDGKKYKVDSDGETLIPL